MQHHTAEAGKLVGALALLARDEAETLTDLARLDAAAEGGHAEAMESALAPLGFRARRATILGYPDDVLVLRRPGDAPPCTFLFHAGLFHAGPPVASAARGVSGAVPRPARDATGTARDTYGAPAAGVARGAPGATRGAPGWPGQLAACLAALRAAARAGVTPAVTPGLVLAPHAGPADLWHVAGALAAAGEIEGEWVRFDGVAVPRVWPGCFGTLEALIRVRGRAPHPGAPGRGVNAIEAGVPVLQALRALGRAVARRGVGPARGEPDAPLRARLTLAAVHGGQRGGSLATVFDVLVNRRYTPAERPDDVLAELDAAVRAALADSPVPEAEVKVTHHAPPVPDPLGARRSRAEAALGFALGWPHEALCLDPAPLDLEPAPDRDPGPDADRSGGWAGDRAPSRPAAALLGGVWRATGDEADEPAAVLAQARAILAYLAAEFRPGTTP